MLYVDPGLGGTGWAVFHGPIPTEYGVIRGKAKHWTASAHDIADEFATLLRTRKIKEVTIEFPSLWTSGKSMASGVRGDLFKLTYLIGCLGTKTVEITKATPVFISPLGWKGQLPKEIVVKRIERQLPGLTGKIPNHAADAIGMGLSAQGKI
jgi:Holliday junction resolvasome RuvABC endonuclease subunit